MRILLSVGVLLALLARPGLAAPKPLALKAGYAETWKFRMAAKDIGQQTATCTAVRTVGGQTVLDFRYTLKLALTMGAQNVNVSMDGTFSVTDKNSPVALTINANVNGSAQKAAYTVEGKTINLSANAGGQDIKRSAQLSGTEALSVNNLMTLMSLATRTLNIGPGQSVKASLFSAEALRSIEITFAAQPKTEQVTIAGKQIDCVVCDISAIASRVYLDKATGEMVKYVMASQGLEVTRQ